jgi:hypothetical protein
MVDIRHDQLHMTDTRRQALIAVDVFCRPLTDQIPVYRLYVNDELFAERSWIWSHEYLEEQIPIHAAPGDYVIRFQVIPPESASLKAKNFRIVESTGGIKLIKNLVRITK